MTECLTTPEAAKVLGLAETTLEKYRVYGTGPQYIKFGKKAVRYRRGDLEAWAEMQLSVSTSQYETPYRTRKAVNNVS